MTIQAMVKALDECDRVGDGNFLKAQKLYKQIIEKAIDEIKDELIHLSLVSTDTAN